MKRYRKILSVFLLISLLAANMSVHAEEDEQSSPGRSAISDEVLGVAVVTKDVSFDENGEVVLSEEIDMASLPMPLAVEGETSTITPGSTTYWYGNWSTNKFTVKTSTGSYTGYCAEPQSPTPSGYYSVSKIDSTTEFGKKLKIALMFGENGPWYSESTALFGNCSWSAVYGYLHAMIGIHYSGQTNGLTDAQVQAVQGALDVMYEQRGNLAELNNYTVYVAYNDEQDIVWLEQVSEITNGDAKLVKCSANAEITAGNDCYSLEGAEYGVYSDSACTDKVAAFTTDSDGNSNIVNIKAGTYYVKELKAPKGYVLDTAVHSMTVTAGEITTLKVSDVPQTNPVELLLEKIDAEKNTNSAQGYASLEDAQFTIAYYDMLSDTDPAVDGYIPERSWVLKTDTDGYCKLNNAYKVSGDDFYTMDGVNVLPLGTITICETKAPEGYLINSQTFVVKITSENTTDQFISTYNQQIIPENILKLNIVKKAKGTDTAISGVTFCHTLPDGTKEEVVTDKNGTVEVLGLTYGTHVIEETSAPDGFSVNAGKVTFQVETDNTITLISNTSVDEEGTMTFSVQEDGGALLEVENILQPYQLKVTKMNENNVLLSDAEFTLYQDEECSEILSVNETDEDGILTFTDLEVGKNYYLKETKAPVGYRIPLNEDGSEIIYKIRTESSPTENLFEYYVNDEKHTEATGSFAITGTTAERIVNLTIINYSGIQMPETGNHTVVIGMMCGIGCMAAGLISSLKKRR